jgi:hypothetical protein
MSIKEQVIEKQNEYYSTNSKSILFKTSQKNNCAEEIKNTFDLSQLLISTVYQIPNTNILFLDYTLFKTFATPQIYDIIINHILERFVFIIRSYNSFQVHLNLDTFSMSAAHRYNEIIKQFCSKCLHADTRYANYMDKLCIYNTPSVMQGISKLFNPLINENVKQRIELIDKKDSETRLKQLFT